MLVNRFYSLIIDVLTLLSLLLTYSCSNGNNSTSGDIFEKLNDVYDAYGYDYDAYTYDIEYKDIEGKDEEYGDIYNEGYEKGMIAVGAHHTCVVNVNGSVKCWGENKYGQLGDGSTEKRLLPVSVVTLSSGVKQVAVGGYHTCALLNNGAVKCWGNNEGGQLGDGSKKDRYIPVDVIGITSGVKKVVAGSYHTCALLDNGAVKCWGAGGRLGDGSAEDNPTPVDVVGLDSYVIDIGAGNAHTCVLLENGGVKCWGKNGDGQLGDGTDGSRYTPGDVVELGSIAQQIAVGGYHTCALLNNGIVKCWGYNGDGQLGNSKLYKSKVPIEIEGLESAVKYIRAGYSSTCFILENDNVKCAGGSIYRYSSTYLVDGATTNIIKDIHEVPGLYGVVDIGIGLKHSCAIIKNGIVKCWGDNGDGLLGIGKISSSLSNPVDVIGLNSPVRDMSAGYDHTCAVLNNGGAKCWGYNIDGRIGDGSTIQRLIPVDVDILNQNVKKIASGAYHNCALLNDGGVKCWGYNYNGQIGDGTTENRIKPVDVSGLSSGVKDISSGDAHTCAVLTSGGVKCWGRNDYGQLGDDTTEDRKTPVDVVGLSSGVKEISAGGYRTCALLENGGVKCWGGDNRNINSTPKDITGLDTGVKSVSVGYWHVWVLLENGGVKCWGYNAERECGEGSNEYYIANPIDVVGLQTGVIAITSGHNHSCALLESGKVKCMGIDLGDFSVITEKIQKIIAGAWHNCAIMENGGAKCWGYNNFGQLGNGESVYYDPIEIIK